MFGNTILFSEMTPPADWEADFNRWYDEEHIPIRMHAPLFRSARRYTAGDRGYLAVYEMDGREALSTPEYQRIKTEPSDLTRRMLGGVSGFTRYIGREIQRVSQQGADFDAPVLYAVWFQVPEDQLSGFDAWYDEDHVPTLMEEPQWLGVRRFAIIDGEPEQYNRLALHYLASRDALESPARTKARGTPWRERLALEPWFKGTYKVFDQYGARQYSQQRA